MQVCDVLSPARSAKLLIAVYVYKNLFVRSNYHITRDVNYGFVLRYLHANGASLFFLCVYLHIGRGLYYGSYTKIIVWNVGVLLFLLMIVTAFLGYVLPWGQMSF